MKHIFRKKNKKGQYYLFTAVILLSFIYSLTSPADPIPDAEERYPELYQNFMDEIKISASSALIEGTSVTTRIEEFTESFIEYAKDSGINFHCIILFGNSESAWIKNFMDEQITITFANSTTTLSVDEITMIKSTEDIQIETTKSDQIHRYSFTNIEQDIKALVVIEKH